MKASGKADDRFSHWRFNSLTAAALVLGAAVLSGGCGSDATPPPAGSEKFEAEKKSYQEARRKEYGRKTFEPEKGKTAGKRK